MTSQARASGSSWCCVRYTAIAPMVRYRCGERDDENGLTEQQLGEIPIPDGPSISLFHLERQSTSQHGKGLLTR